jgi:hypothetical protein
MIGTMDVFEAMAIAQLRRWANLKVANQYGKVRNYERQGWQRRSDRSFDASLVTVIDFERALGALTND